MKRVIGGTLATPLVTASGPMTGTRTWLMRRSRPLGVRSCWCQGSAEKVPDLTAARKSVSDQVATCPPPGAASSGCADRFASKWANQDLNLGREVPYTLLVQFPFF